MSILPMSSFRCADLTKLARIFSKQGLERGHRGLIHSWAGIYNGPESCWGDGWTCHPDPEASDIAGLLGVAPQFDFLIHEPGSVQGFTELLEDPRLARSHLNRPFNHYILENRQP